MKALIHNCTTDEHIIKDFLNESEIRAFQETLKMADRETNFNIYYNEATAATPKKHIVDAGEGFKCTSVCYDITWNLQMECYSYYPVYTVEGFIEKCNAVEANYDKMIKGGNWDKDYKLSDEYLDVFLPSLTPKNIGERKRNVDLFKKATLHFSYENLALTKAMVSIKKAVADIEMKIASAKAAKQKAYNESRNSLGNLFPELANLA